MVRGERTSQTNSMTAALASPSRGGAWIQSPMLASVTETIDVLRALGLIESSSRNVVGVGFVIDIAVSGGRERDWRWVSPTPFLLQHIGCEYHRCRQLCSLYSTTRARLEAIINHNETPFLSPMPIIISYPIATHPNIPTYVRITHLFVRRTVTNATFAFLGYRSNSPQPAKGSSRS